MKKQIQKIITTISLATVIGLSIAFVEQGAILAEIQENLNGDEISTETVETDSSGSTDIVDSPKIKTRSLNITKQL